MNSRSARGPLVIGLGTAAILAASTAALAGTGAPTPTADASATPTPTPTPRLTVHTVAPSTAYPGQTVTVIVKITATQGKLHPTVDLAIDAGSKATVNSASPNCTLDSGETCPVGNFDSAGTRLTFKVTISSTYLHGEIPFTATATDESKAFTSGSDESDITIAPKPTPSPTTHTPTPTPSPTKTSSSPTPTPTATHSSGSNGSGGGASNPGAVNPQGLSSPIPSPSVALPAITGTPLVSAPSVAPDGSTAQPAGNTTALRSGSSTEDLTFERLASTQAAWLAALLVAFSLLLTQVRLGRRPNSPLPTAQFKGAHRRSRKGMFQA